MALFSKKTAMDFTEMGDECVSSGKYQKAISCYDQALELDPGYIPALCGKGKLMSFYKKKEKAISLFETALTIYPENVTALNNLAWNYNSIKRYRDAIIQCDKALEVDPTSAESWSIKGYSFYKLAKYTASLQCCKTAKELDSARVHLYEKDAAEKEAKERERLTLSLMKEALLEEIKLVNPIGYESRIDKIRILLEDPEKYPIAKKEWDEIKNEILEKEKIEKARIEKERLEIENARSLIKELREKKNRLIQKGVVISADFGLLQELVDNKCFDELTGKVREIDEYLKKREDDFDSVNEVIRNTQSPPKYVHDLCQSGNYQEAFQSITLWTKVKSHLERELSTINTRGFEKEVKSIYSLLNDPSDILKVEDEIEHLKDQIKEREKSQIAEKTLSNVVTFIESLQKEGLVLNDDINSRISIINDMIMKKMYDSAVEKTESLESDLAELKSCFDNAKQHVKAVNSVIAIQLFERGDYQKTEEYCISLKKTMDTLRTQVSKTQNYFKIPDSVTEVLASNEYDKATDAIDTLQRIHASAEPRLTASIEDKEYKFKESNKVTLIVQNSGEVHVRDVRASFCEDFTVKRISPINKINSCETGKTMFAMVPNIAGEVPLDITIDCIYGPDNRHYKTLIQQWIQVLEGTNVKPKEEPVDNDRRILIHPEEELFRRYSGIELKGQGNFAKVYKAKRKDGKYVALKVPINTDESTGKSFIAEIQNWTKLDHANIVKIYSFNILPIPYIEMEFCEESLVNIKKPLDYTKAASLIFDIAKGLDYAHSKKIIHRDLKPQNILLSEKNPKISDWGLSKVISKTSSTTTTSYTPYYAAPEQINNKSKDERTDIWQLGVIFYELVTGELPFKGETLTEIATNICLNSPKRVGEINPAAKNVEPVIMKCLEKDPRKRYQSAIDLQKGINEFLNDSYLRQPKSSPPEMIRAYEYYGGYIRVKISVKNLSSLTISDVILEPYVDPAILSLEKHEPEEYILENERIFLQTIRPNNDRTVSLYFQPTICAKEGTDIDCHLRYKDAQGSPRSLDMDPLRIQVICPIFETKETINIGMLKQLIDSLAVHDTIPFSVPKTLDAPTLLRMFQSVIQLHDIRHISTLKRINNYESWYYGKTKINQNEMIIKLRIAKDIDMVEIEAYSNNQKDLTGLLAEIGRHINEELSAKDKSRKKFNIKFGDGIMPTQDLINLCDAAGNCDGDVSIEFGDIVGLRQNNRNLKTDHQFRCPECQNLSTINDKFCMECGHKFE